MKKISIGAIAVVGAIVLAGAALSIKGSSEERAAAEQALGTEAFPESLKSPEPPISVPDTWEIDSELMLQAANSGGHIPENYWIWHDTTAEDGQYVSLTIYDSEKVGVYYDSIIANVGQGMASVADTYNIDETAGLGGLPGAHVYGQGGDFAQVDVWISQAAGAVVEIDAYWPTTAPTASQSAELESAVDSFSYTR